MRGWNTLVDVPSWSPVGACTRVLAFVTKKITQQTHTEQTRQYLVGKNSQDQSCCLSHAVMMFRGQSSFRVAGSMSCVDVHPSPVSAGQSGLFSCSSACCSRVPWECHRPLLGWHWKLRLVTCDLASQKHDGQQHCQIPEDLPCGWCRHDPPPPTVPQSVLIKDDWSWGPGATEGRGATEAFCQAATHPQLSAEAHLRDCRMAFIKHVLPKFRRPVAPSAAESYQRRQTSMLRPRNNMCLRACTHRWAVYSQTQNNEMRIQGTYIFF